MPTNFWMFFVVALIPLMVGAFYYNDKIVGNTWKKVNGFTDEDLSGANMGLIFGLTYLCSVIIAFFLQTVVIHQSGVFGVLMPDAMESGSETQKLFNDLMAQFGDNHRSFKHGAMHGAMAALLLIAPALGINAMFERRGWKYVLIHAGYWVISLALMGGILCATLKFTPLS